MAIPMAAKIPKAKLWLRFRHLDDGLSADLLKKLDDLPDGGNKFLDDFVGAPDETLRKFLNNPELVDAWRKMDNLGVDDAIRRNPGALDALSKPKGYRPDPSEYLDADYIQNHLSKFDDGEKGTNEMDCSEFAARFLQKACGLEEVPDPFYTSLMLDGMQDGSLDSFLQHVKNSEKEDFKDIRPGDVFLWSRSASDGHTGVVVSYDKETDMVTVIEAIGASGAAEESLSKDLEGYCKGCIRKSIYTRTGRALYKHAGWKGYFRAVTTK